MKSSVWSVWRPAAGKHQADSGDIDRRIGMRTRAAIVIVGVVAMMALLAGSAWAQSGNPRFGQWKLKSDAQAPASNIMTYEPYQGTGMRITIDAVDARGERSQWGYTTMFDGKDEPLYGNPNTDTGAVRQISDRVNEIVYKKNGVVTQILTNVLSPDGQTIGVLYMRMDATGQHVTNITVATYEKM
jgi:hypothetical protein